LRTLRAHTGQTPGRANPRGRAGRMLAYPAGVQASATVNYRALQTAKANMPPFSRFGSALFAERGFRGPEFLRIEARTIEHHFGCYVENWPKRSVSLR
jgi:hypothetical protein